MKRIKLTDYSENMGTLIALDDKQILVNSVYIPYDRLIYHFKELLDKNKPYYIICSGGVKSKKIVSILELYGYNVTQVYKE